MNYRHAFHAGNFADVVKHVVLARILAYLGQKDAPYRVLDTHAGAGLYDLHGDEAQRTGEWEAGIGAVLRASFSPAVTALLAPWLKVVAEVNPGAGDDLAGNLRHYPGSPLIAQALTRAQDRLLFCETEPGVRAALEGATGRDNRVKVLSVDGWQGMNAYLPPKERRGVVLVDPPFEQPGEFKRLSEGLAESYQRWSTGIYALWYPIKDVSVPRPKFDRHWDNHLAELKATLKAGENVLIHCRGGLGRAGMVACRLLTDLGQEPDEALRIVRRARPGAVETDAQEDWVLNGCESEPCPLPSRL